MKERPIIFSAPMVRALLAGTKTQTRRIVKPTRRAPLDFLGGGSPGGGDWNDPSCWGYSCDDGRFATLWPEDDDHFYPRSHGWAGDRLWVRERGLEHMRVRLFIHDATPGRWWTAEDGGRYGASYSDDITRASLLQDHKVRPSIHMPRWACRIVLEITDVRVQRLQEISEADARAEGIAYDPGEGGIFYVPGMVGCAAESAVDAFRKLWESINGAGSWDANPWVWAMTFRRSV